MRSAILQDTPSGPHAPNVDRTANACSVSGCTSTFAATANGIQQNQAQPNATARNNGMTREASGSPAPRVPRDMYVDDSFR